MIIDTNHPEYIKLRKKTGKGKYNGCYYYSKEIVDNIIPNVKTDRDWNVVGRELSGMHDGMIVFLHDNSTPWHYDWLKNYHDLILVCSSEYTRNSVIYWGKTILLPMSIDVEYVERFKVAKKTKGTCFVGNPWVYDNLRGSDIDPTNFDKPTEMDFLSGMRRTKLLKRLAQYRKAMAIDRCAMEALVLDCELIPINTRYGCDNIGRVFDNRDAAKILQEELDKIDGGGVNEERKARDEARRNI